MQPNTFYLKRQYDMVCQSRQSLFDYCTRISLADFVEENNSFGKGISIRNLLVHIVNTYESWIVNRGLKRNMHYTSYEEIHNLEEVTKLYKLVDTQMFEFFVRFENKTSEQIHYKKDGIEGTTSALELFTHVISHEFHHKGQILSLSRHLGYIPVDTDVLR